LLLSKFSKELSLNNLNKSETKKNYKFKEIKKNAKDPSKRNNQMDSIPRFVLRLQRLKKVKKNSLKISKRFEQRIPRGRNSRKIPSKFNLNAFIRYVKQHRKEKK